MGDPIPLFMFGRLLSMVRLPHIGPNENGFHAA